MGYNVYKNFWTPDKEQKLATIMGPFTIKKKFADKVMNKESSFYENVNGEAVNQGN